MRFTLARYVFVMAILVANSRHSAGEKTGMAISITKRSSLVHPDKNVNMDALDSHAASLKAKVLHGFENYEKNTGTRHPSTVQTYGKRQNRVPLSRTGMWYGTVSVGTPAKPFAVQFDTGSCDFFLPASACITCTGHSLWDPASSSSSEDLRAPIVLNYAGESTVSGHLYNDTVSIAGLNASHQAITAATTYSDRFQDNHFAADGLMGMCFQSLSAYGASSVIETLVSQGQMVPAVFSFKLSDSGGELYVGGSNPDLYSGSFTFVPVTVKGYWQVTVDMIQVTMEWIGVKDYIIYSNIAAMIDTGASLISGPRWEVYMMYTALGGTILPGSGAADFYALPCNSFPTISLGFGGRTFQIPPSSLKVGPASLDSSYCLSGIMGLETTSSLWIIGDVFLQNVYTTFDVNGLQVGFAQLVVV